MPQRTFRGITRAEARAIDERATRELGIPSLCLMESAGAGAARIAMESGRNLDSGVVCVCGPGSNGGDALVVARHLAAEGISVALLDAAGLARTAPGGDVAIQRGICAAMRLLSVPIACEEDLATAADALSRASLVVDGLFGTGLVRPIAGPLASLVEAMNESGAPILALDLPSGLDCDSGEPLGPCVRAEITATFVARKAGFSNPRSSAWTGQVVVVGIGAPAVWPPA